MCQGIGKAGNLLCEAAWLDAVHLRRGGELKAKESEARLEEGKTCSLQGLKGADDKGTGQACGQEQCNVPTMRQLLDPQTVTAKLKCWTNLHRYAVALPTIAMTAKLECWTCIAILYFRAQGAAQTIGDSISRSCARTRSPHTPNHALDMHSLRDERWDSWPSRQRTHAAASASLCYI